MIKKILLLITAFLLLATTAAFANNAVTVGTVSFTDENGGGISQLSSNKFAVVNVPVISNRSNQPVTLIVAIYNKNDEMMSFQITSTIIDELCEKTLSAGVIAPSDNDVYRDYTLKAFLWEDFLYGNSLYSGEITLK